MRTKISTSVDISTTVDAEICVDELDDEDLMACVAVARARGLVLTPSGTQPDASLRERLIDVQRDIMSRNWARARGGFDAVLWGEQADSLRDVFEAIATEQWNAALALLDRVIDPSPAATAKEIPKEWRNGQAGVA